MKKKFMSRLVTTVMLATCIVGLAACGAKEPEKTADVEEVTEEMVASEEVEETEDSEDLAENVVADAGVFSGEIKINGTSITFPCTMEEINKTGLTLVEDEANKELDDNTFMYVSLFSGDTMTDGSVNALSQGGKNKVQDCTMYGLLCSNPCDDESIQFELPNGVTNNSTMEEVRAAFDGMEPAFDEDGQLTYLLDNTQMYTNSYSFEYRDGKMVHMSAKYEASLN